MPSSYSYSLSDDNLSTRTYCALCGRFYAEKEWEKHKKICYRKRPFKGYSIKKNQTIKKGDKIKSLRHAGIEIEFLIPETTQDRFHSKPFFEELSTFGGLGIGSDPSVRNIDFRTGTKIALEIQTPPLSGRKLENYITKLFKHLKKYKVTVNRTCGLHLHLDAKDFNRERKTNYNKLAYVVDFYLILEKWLYDMVKKDRKTNRFSRSIHYNAPNRKHIDGLKENKSPELPSNAFNIFGTSIDHFAGLSILGVIRDKPNKNFEIRYYHATKDYKEVLNWIAVHQAIIDHISTEFDKKNTKNLDNLLTKLDNSIKRGHKPHQLLKKMGLTRQNTQFITQQIKKHK